MLVPLKERAKNLPALMIPIRLLAVGVLGPRDGDGFFPPSAWAVLPVGDIKPVLSPRRRKGVRARIPDPEELGGHIMERRPNRKDERLRPLSSFNVLEPAL